MLAIYLLMILEEENIGSCLGMINKSIMTGVCLSCLIKTSLFRRLLNYTEQTIKPTLPRPSCLLSLFPPTFCSSPFESTSVTQTRH